MSAQSDKRMRDWLGKARSARMTEIMRGAAWNKPKPPAIKQRLDDLEEARDLKALMGQDPY